MDGLQPRSARGRAAPRSPPGRALRRPLGVRPILRIVRRGILGGTFDPPHLAHLVAGEAAYRELGLDVVTFLPAGAPWQKAGTGVSPPGHRWAMTCLAADGVGYFEPDDREVRREGWTYTADTLDTFPAGEDLVLILGADAAAGIPTWHRSGDVLARASLAVMPRTGVDPARVEAAVGAHHRLATPELPISGTMIRRRRHDGEPIRFLVPEAVFSYVEAHGLYV